MKGLTRGSLIWKNIRRHNKMRTKKKKLRKKSKNMTIVDFNRESVISFINYVKKKKGDN